MRGTALALAFFVIACGPTPKQGNGGDDNGGGDDDATIDAGETYFDSSNMDPDASCGAQMQQIGVVNLGDPPDLLVVLDRSGSMSSPPMTFPPVFDTKWSIMRNALNQIAAQKDQNIKFGLLEFPSDDNCSADANPEVAIQLGAHTAIASYFAGRSPGGNTPAHVALGSALSYYQTIPTNPAGRYVLFANQRGRLKLVDLTTGRPLARDVTSLQARVVRGLAVDAPRPMIHMVLLVHLDEGEFIADVGYGNLAPTAPLKLEPLVEQPTPHETMR